jgi:hypothetical protein
MRPPLKQLLERLAVDSEFADRFFAGPDLVLEEMGVDASDWEALARLDRDAVLYMVDVETHEPGIAVEHPSNNAQNRWVTPLIGLWGCAAYVVFWLLFGGKIS